MRNIVAAIVFFCLQQTAQAQTVEWPYLAGVSKISFNIEQLADDAKRCGISEQIIREAAMDVLSPTALMVVRVEPGVPALIAEVDILQHKSTGMCFTTLRMRLASFHVVPLGFGDNSLIPAWAEVWRDTWLQASLPQLHAHQLRTAVEDSTKKFVTQWYLANKDNR